MSESGTETKMADFKIPEKEKAATELKELNTADLGLSKELTEALEQTGVPLKGKMSELGTETKTNDFKIPEKEKATELKELNLADLGLSKDQTEALEQSEISVSKSTKASLKVYKSGDRTSTCLEFEDRVLEQQLLVFPSVVSLNVGGYIYTSTAFTLNQFPEAKLAQMCNGTIPVPKDLRGQRFIDRDGATFRYVLTYLRTGKLTLPDNFRYFDELLTEAEFYEIESLIEEIRQRIKKESEAKENIYIRLAYNAKPIKGVVLSGKLDQLQEIIPDIKGVGGTLYSSKDYHFTVPGGTRGDMESGSGGVVTVKGAQMKIPLKNSQVDAFVQHVLSRGYGIKGSAVAFDDNDNKVWYLTRN